ncbi:MAG: zinc ribbon domain-containing protein [Planctomycetes bacterium]|nr:zinc ribbon domain-containing protein [Planctomycetota bacterium]
MPTYDYQCDACNHTFEEFQSMMDKPLKKCPKCKKSKLRRLIGTGAAIIFKGSGFYQTDYRSESYKSAAKAEETKPSSTDGEASKSKSDAKSADQSASAGAKDTSSTSSPAKKPKS